MIAHLRGTVTAKTTTHAIVDVGGVGYFVACNPDTLSKLHEGRETTVRTYLHVREDALELYGFLMRDEVELFHKLITVSGVGPKSAQHILALGPPSEIRGAIGRGDVSFLTRVSGIGRKTAERIVVELKDTLKDGKEAAPHGDVLGDAVDALVALGYSVAQARDAVRKVNRSEVTDVEGAVRAALKGLGRT